MNVLILSASASAINYIRSLKEVEEINLVVTDCNRTASGLYHQHVTPYVIPRASKLKNYRTALEEIIETEEIDLLIPTSDFDVQGVMELLNEGWTPEVEMFKPNYCTYRSMFNKKELAQKVNKFGFSVPKIYDSIKDVTLSDLPVVIKPVKQGGAKGVWIVETKEELKYRVNSLEGRFEDLLIQEYIPGNKGSVYVVLLLYDQSGEIYGEVATRSLKTFMSWGGGGNAGEVVDQPALINKGKKIVEKLGGWKGPINLEFKQHPEAGDFYLMEINCRLNGYSYLHSMNGLNFPKAIIDLLNKGQTEHLHYDNPNEDGNFILGFREKYIKENIPENNILT